MKVTTETVATREVMLTIEPDPATVEKAMRKTAREVSRHRPVPGFRPGKAPYGMVERIFGREFILDQAIKDLANDLYRQALEEAKIEPFEQGKMDVASQDPVVLKVTVPLAPVVTLGDYRSLHIEPEPEVAVDEGQVDQQIALERRRHAQYETIERPIQIGDQIVASIKGMTEGESLVDQEEMTVNVEEQLPPPGFAEALVGLMPGETREFALTYPQDYEDSKFAGKNVSFTVSVKTVRKVILPEINDDLAKMVGDYESLVALREGLAVNLKQRLASQAREREDDRALEALVAGAQAEYPAALVQREVDATLERQKTRVQQMGYTWENYLRITGHPEEQLREELRPEAERRAVQQIVLRELAKAESIKVEAQEMREELQGIASAYGDRATEVFQRLSGDTNANLALYGDLLARKAVRKLAAILTGREEAELAEPASDEVIGSEPAHGETDESVMAGALQAAARSEVAAQEQADAEVQGDTEVPGDTQATGAREIEAE